MKLAIVGLGRQGQIYVEALHRMVSRGLITLSGVCDIEEPYLSKSASYLGTKAYSDFRNLIVSEKPEFIILSLPNSAYQQVIEFCAEQGVHILKEKPSGMKLKEAEMFQAVTAQHNVAFCVAQQRFFSAPYRLAKRWIDDYKIGEILNFEYRYTLNDRVQSWYWNHDAGGGCWLNIGWHMCFLVSWFFGNPIESKPILLSSNRRSWLSDTDDTVYYRARFENGIIGAGYLSVVDPNKENSFIIRGTTGTVSIYKHRAFMQDNYGLVLEEASEMDELLAIERLIETFTSYGDISSEIALSQLQGYNTMSMQMIQSGFEQNI